MRFIVRASRFLVRLAWFLAVVTAVIVVHELGHFLAAKALGYPVEEFSVGMFGPSLGSFELWGTPFDFKVGLIGGYNSFDEATWQAMGWGHKTLTLLAGSGLSLLAAFGFLYAYRREELGRYARVVKLEAGYPFYGWIRGALDARAGRDPEPGVLFPKILSRDFALFMLVTVNAFNLSYFIAFLDGGKIVNLAIANVLGISSTGWQLAVLPAALMLVTIAVTLPIERRAREKRQRERREALAREEAEAAAEGAAP